MKNKTILITTIIVMIMALSLSVVAAGDNSTDEIITSAADDLVVDEEIATTAGDDSGSVDDVEINNSDDAYSINSIDIPNKKNDDVEDAKNILGTSDYDMLTSSADIAQVSIDETMLAGYGASMWSTSCTVSISGPTSKSTSVTATYLTSVSGVSYFNIRSAQFDGPLKPGSYTVSYSINGASQTIVSSGTTTSFTISKADTSISSSGSSYTYGATGSQTVYSGTVNGKKGSVSMEGDVYIYRGNDHVATVRANADGKFSYSISSTSLNPSDYTYTCYYGGNTYYNGYGSATDRKASKKITVSKIDAPGLTSISSADYIYGDSSNSGNKNVYSGKFSKQGDVSLAGTVTIYRDGTSVDTKEVDANGNWKYEISTTSLAAGKTYTFTANYNGNTYYKAASSASGAKQITVAKATVQGITSIASEGYTYGDSSNGGTKTVFNGQFKKYGNADMTGKVTIYRGTTSMGTYDVDKDGKWSYSISTTSLNPGSYTYKVTYNSNNNYDAYTPSGTTGTKTIIVSKADVSSITAYYSNYAYGDAGNQKVFWGKFTKYGNADMTGIGTIYVNGNPTGDTVAVDAEGNWNLMISSTDYPVGEYVYTITYSSTKGYYNDYGDSETTGAKTVTVSKGTPVISIDSRMDEDTYPGKITITVTVTNENGDTVRGITLTPSGTGFAASPQGTDANGKAIFTVAGLNASEYTDWVFTSTENKNYESVVSERVDVFKINKQVPNVEYTVTTTSDTYPGVKTITLTLTDNSGERLVGFRVIPEGEGIDLADGYTNNRGIVSFTVNNLAAKTYDNWNFTVYQTNNYDTKVISLDPFTIKPYEVTINVATVDPTVSTYESTITLTGTVTYPTGGLVPRGKVYATLGDKTNYTTVNEDGTYTLQFVGVVPGLYYQLTDAYFESAGDETNYTGSAPEDITINRVAIYKSETTIPSLIVHATGDDWTYGKAITLDVTVVGVGGHTPTGNLTVYVNGNYNKVYGTYTLVEGDMGNHQFRFTNTPAGYNRYTVVYAGDDYYYECTNNSAEFKVEPAEMQFDSVTVTNGVYNGTGPSAYINVTVASSGEGEPPRGLIRVTLADDSRSWTGTLVGNNTIVYINKLAVGTYNDVVVSYEPAGDELNYAEKKYENKVGFIIDQGNPDFAIEAPSVGVGENAYISIRLPSDAEGTVTLKVGTETYVFDDLLNNRTVLIISPAAGAHPIEASYSGDHNWTGVPEFKTKLYVERPGATLIFTTDNINYGEDMVIDFNIYYKNILQTNASGNITVYGLGEENGQVIQVSHGKARLTVSNLTMGSYNVVAYYAGYNDLAGNINVSSFKVLGLISPMELQLNASTIDAGTSVLLTVTMDSSIEDPIYLYVDGERYAVGMAENGVAQFIISGLSSGTHDLTTTFVSDGRYNDMANNTTVTVDKINPKYVVDVVADSNKNILFNIYIAEGAEGTVRVVGNGTNKRLSVEDGYADLSILNVATGVYVFNITYSGDDIYNGFNTTATVDANKIGDYSMTITNTPAALGKTVIVYVSLPVIFAGKTVELYVDGADVPRTATVDATGIATFNDVKTITTEVSNISVVAYFEGDDSYANKTISKTIFVDRISDYDFEVIVNPTNVYVGDDVVITFNLPTSDIPKVNLTINGVNIGEVYTTEPYHINNVSEGSYAVYASYVGDTVYYPASDNATFTVTKKNTTLDVSVGSIVYGDDVVINIKVDDGTTGIILVTLDGNEYKYINITQSQIEIRDSSIPVGSHSIEVSFVENRIYNGVNSGERRFEVSKNSTYDFTATLNDKTVVDGATVTFKDENLIVFEFGLPKDATGTVTIYLTDSKGNVRTQVVNLPNNVTTVNFNKFDTYGIDLSYSGDGNYEPRLLEFTLDLGSEKIIPVVNFNKTRTGILYAGWDQNILYIDSENYIGNKIALYIDGVYQGNFTIDDSLSASRVLNELTAGIHLFALKYDGDDFYNSLDVQDTFEVVKTPSNTKIDIEVGRVTELTKFTVSIVDADNHVISDASGYIVINISGQSQILEIENGVISLNNTYLVNGTYAISAEYRGNNKYDGSSKTVSFTIDKFQTTVGLERTEIAYVENFVVIIRYNGAVAGDANGELLYGFDDDNVDKVAIVENGYANITQLPVAGDHTLTIRYLGDEKYNISQQTFNVKIGKLPNVPIIVPSIVYIGQELNISVGDNKTDGYIDISIEGGAVYTAEVVNGIAVIPLTELPQDPDPYIIEVSYYDGSVYEDKEIMTVFTISQITDYVFNITDVTVKYGDDASIIITLPEYTYYQNLLVIVNDADYYYVDINNGYGLLTGITNLDIGENTVESYYEDDIYAERVATAVITVIPNDIAFNITVPSEILSTKDQATVSIKTNVTLNAPITVYVNGKPRTETLIDGEVTFTIDNLEYGEYVVFASFDGNDYYNPEISEHESFLVAKSNATLTLSVSSNIKLGDIVNITVNINDDATGIVLITVANEGFFLNLTAGEYVVQIPALADDTYDVVANYLGDEVYNPVTNTTSFTVGKLDTAVALNRSLINLGEDLIIVIKHNDEIVNDATGTVTIGINGGTLTRDVVNGVAVLEAEYLVQSVGDYSIDVSYSGNDYYFDSQGTLDFTIKANDDIGEIKVDEVIKIGDELNIYFYEVANGKVNITINGGEMFTLDAVGKSVSISADKLPTTNGTYDITIAYYGDANHKNKTVDLTFNSTKVTDYTFTITDASVVLGENATVEITLPDDVTLLGFIVNVNGVNYTVGITNGHGKLENISNLVVGNNVVSATFGNNKYETSNATSTISVAQGSVSLEIILPTADLYVGESAIISVKANVTLNAPITVYINGKAKTKTLVDGEATFTIDDLEFGYYTLFATFAGNKNYTAAVSDEATFNVSKRQVTFNVTAENVTVGEKTTVKINIDAEATGFVLIAVDNEIYVVNITAKQYEVELPVLGNGTYTVIASYLGDDIYDDCDNYTEFSVEKLAPSIIPQSPIEFGDDLVIIVKYDGAKVENATGKLRFTINGDDVTINANVVDGKAIIAANKLPSSIGTYTATIEYLGDNNYAPVTVNSAFTITEVAAPIVVPSNVSIGDDLIINITGATDGKLNVTIDNGEMFTVTVGSGKAVIPAAKLPDTPGSYDINLTYYDSSAFSNTNYETVFDVNKVTDYTFTISDASVVFGENATVEITLPDDVNLLGFIVNVNGQNYTVGITNGHGKLENINNLVVGSNNVSAAFGNGKYADSTATAEITVSQADLSLEIILPTADLYVGESAIIEIKANVSITAPITVYINGKAQTTTLTDGEGLIIIDDLAYGEYIVTANFAGNENYTAASASEAKFNVSKVDPTFSITVPEMVEVGDNVTVTVHIDSDATGYVIVTMGDVSKLLDITAGKFEASFVVLENGTFTVVAQYLGDDKYDAEVNYTTFTVGKFVTSVGLNRTPINLDEDLVIVILHDGEIVNDATGTVVITIGDDDYTRNVVNGIATLESTYLPSAAGNYSVGVVYSGDARYVESQGTLAYAIKSNGDIGPITIDDEILVGSDLNIYFHETANGKVNVIIGDGDMFTLDAVGKVVTIPAAKLPESNGTYDVEIVYYGDARYDEKVVNLDVTLNKIALYPFVISGDSVVLGENATVEITLPDDVSLVGFVVNVNGKDYTVAITNGYGKLENINNLVVGTNDVSATFGNGKYETRTATSEIYADQGSVALEVIVPTGDLFVGQTTIVTVKSNVSISTPITVYINGKAQTHHIDGGETTFDIPDLVYGEYVVFASFAGDENYTAATSNVVTFNVNKNVPTFNITSVDTIEVGNVITVTVNIDDDATGLVIITLGDDTKVLNLSSGKEASFVVYNNGTNTVSANYLGDDKYDVASSSTTFTAEKSSKDISLEVILPTADLHAGDSAIVSVKANVTLNAPITVYINGKAQTEMLENGEVTFIIPDLVYGEYVVFASFAGNEFYNAATSSDAVFNVTKYDPVLTVSTVSTATIGDVITVTINIDDNATGLVFVSIGEDAKVLNITNKEYQASFVVKTNGTNTVVANYLGDDIYYASTNTATFVADKVATDVELGDIKITLGEDLLIYVKSNGVVLTDASGVLTVKLNKTLSSVLGAPLDDGETIFADVIGGVAVISASALPDQPGTYLLEVQYQGDDVYAASDVALLELAIAKSEDTAIMVQSEVEIGKDLLIYVGDGTADGKVNVTINDGETITLDVVNSTAYVPASSLPDAVSKNIIKVDYYGGSVFADESVTTIFHTVKVKEYKFEINAAERDDDVLISVDMDERISGVVNIAIGNKTATVNVVGGKGNTSVVLPAGQYEIVANYTGDDTFESKVVTHDFTKAKESDYSFIITAEETVAGKTAVIGISLPGDATGVVLIDVRGEKYYVDINAGTGVLPLSIADYENGTYTVTGKYLGNDLYTSGENFTDLVVTQSGNGSSSDAGMKVKVLNSNITVGEYGIVLITFTADINDVVSVTVNNGIAQNATVTNGVAIFNVPADASGEYVVVVNYAGDSQYDPSEATVNFTVAAGTLTTDISVENAVYGENAIVTITVPEDATGELTVTFNGKKYTDTIKDGKATVTIPNLGVGDNNVTITYPGDKNYASLNETVVISVAKKSTAIVVSAGDIFVGQNASISIVVDGDATGSVVVTVNGKEYPGTLVDGAVVIPVSGLAYGEYTVVANYAGDEYFNATSGATSFKVSKLASVIDVVDIGEKFVITGVLKDITGNAIGGAEISYTIDGVTNTTSTLANGSFTFVGVNHRVIAIGYGGNASILPTNTSITLNVGGGGDRLSTYIVGDTFTQYAIDYYAGERGGYFEVQLFDQNGKALANKPVKIGFNGVTYNSVTNATGWAKLQINLRGAGSYTFAVGFLGDDDYMGSMEVYVIKVNKKPINIAAKAASYKASAAKKYTVTLSTNPCSSIDGKAYLASGKKVTLTLNGVTYAAKTNANGQATFSLSISKKGTYTASVSFAGDSAYNAASKSVKITIK